jgi:hypothetical protein
MSTHLAYVGLASLLAGLEISADGKLLTLAAGRQVQILDTAT